MAKQQDLLKYTRTKLQTQKKPCIGYSRHSMSSCRTGVASPTTKLKNQFEAVESETPLARKVRGMICIDMSVSAR